MSIWPSPRRGKEEDEERGRRERRKKGQRTAAAGSHREEGAVFPLSENLERRQEGHAVKSASSTSSWEFLKNTRISTLPCFITAQSSQLKTGQMLYFTI